MTKFNKICGGGLIGYLDGVQSGTGGDNQE